MEFGFIDVLKLIGALGFFIFGMKIMSEGIQKAAGNSLRRILSMMTKNRYLGVLTGFLVTCLVQSSSASTVMAVSFVNAGLLSLVESAGIMLGANIGATITGWLVAVLGFKVKIAAIEKSILFFCFSIKEPSSSFFCFVISTCEAVIDKRTASKIEHKKEIPIAIEKYININIKKFLIKSK